MATTLQLQFRDARDAIMLPIGLVRDRLASADGKAELLEQLGKAVDAVKRHDKRTLEEIVNWVPEAQQGQPSGVPLTEAAKWFKLAKRVADLDETREGAFTLSDYQVTLIWGRLTDARFRLVAISPAFVEFVLEFQSATGRHFPEEEPDAGEGEE